MSDDILLAFDPSRYQKREITRGTRKGQQGWYDVKANKFMPAAWQPRQPKPTAPKPTRRRTSSGQPSDTTQKQVVRATAPPARQIQPKPVKVAAVVSQPQQLAAQQPKPRPAQPPLQSQQQMQRIQVAARQELANTNHPMNRYKGNLAVANFGSGAVRTLRSTQDMPLSSADHAAMDRMHSRTAAALHLVGDQQGAKAQLEAAIYHRRAASAKSVTVQAVMSVEKHLAASNVSQAHKQAYSQAARSVIKNMTPEAAKRFSANLNGISFSENIRGVEQQIADMCEQDGDYQNAARFRSGNGETAGAYAESKRRLFLDGGRDESIIESDRIMRNLAKMLPTGSGPAIESERRGVLTHEIYAHEFSHVIDGPDAGISRSKEWGDAYMKEIVGNLSSSAPLTDYARTNLQEGFAEFGRMLLTDSKTAERASQNFPMCYAVWAAHGLVTPVSQSGSTDRSGGRMVDVFSQRVPIGDDTSHADMLRSELKVVSKKR